MNFTKPKINSEWTHRNGNSYRVLMIANEGSEKEDYPVTVIYQGLQNGKIWSRPLSDWYRSMSYKVDPDTLAASGYVEEKDWNGCHTGDCPHETQAQCDEALKEVKKFPVSSKRTDYTCDGLVFTFNGRDLFWVENSTMLTALNYHPSDGEPEDAIRSFCATRIQTIPENP